MLGWYITKGIYISDLCFTFWVHVRMEMKAFHAGGIWQSTQIARQTGESSDFRFWRKGILASHFDEWMKGWVIKEKKGDLSSLWVTRKVTHTNLISTDSGGSFRFLSKLHNLCKFWGGTVLHRDFMRPFQSVGPTTQTIPFRKWDPFSRPSVDIAVRYAHKRPLFWQKGNQHKTRGIHVIHLCALAFLIYTWIHFLSDLLAHFSWKRLW